MVSVLGLSLPLLLTVIGVVLVVAEALAPGAHLIVLGVALLSAGLVGLLDPATFGQPLAAAALVLVSGAAALYVYRRFDFYGGKGTDQTSDSETLVGEEAQVVERVTGTSGRVHVEGGGFDPSFAARSGDGEIAVGETVVVVDAGGGSVLTVARRDDAGDGAAEQSEADTEGGNAA
jgi:membrane protein implicated in regulation of membrane protease activity